MKRLFKKMISIMALLMFCTTILACLFGCTGKDDNRFDTDRFCCMYNEDKTGVTILSLTKKGKEQEVLVIPEEINGLPVVQLGGTTAGYPYHMEHYLQSDIIKRIYVKAKLKFISESAIRGNISIVFIGDIKDLYITTSGFTNKTLIVIPENEKDYMDIFDYHVRKKGAEIKIANIMYFLDEEKKDIYWIDYYDLKEEIVFPPAPISNGRMLEGWYIDNEKFCEGSRIKQEEKIDLIAKWIDN